MKNTEERMKIRASISNAVRDIILKHIDKGDVTSSDPLVAEEAYCVIVDSLVAVISRFGVIFAAKRAGNGLDMEEMMLTIVQDVAQQTINHMHHEMDGIAATAKKATAPDGKNWN